MTAVFPPKETQIVFRPVASIASVVVPVSAGTFSDDTAAGLGLSGPNDVNDCIAADSGWRSSGDSPSAHPIAAVMQALTSLPAVVAAENQFRPGHNSEACDRDV
jgi:hypothetical protein